MNLGSLLQTELTKNAKVSNMSGALEKLTQAEGTQNSVALREAVAQLKKYMAGDILSGQVLQQKENQIEILLSGGQQIYARLQGDVGIQEGQQLLFQVLENSEKHIQLKALDQNSQEMLMIGKALSQAGMSMNEETISMVKNLLENNMPIDKKSLNGLSRQMMNFPEASVDSLVRLNKLEIPVTREHILQFEAYRSYEHSITGNVQQLTEAFSEQMKAFAVQKQPEAAIELFQNIIEVFDSEGNELKATIQEFYEQLKQEIIPKEYQSLLGEQGKEPETAKDVIKLLQALANTKDLPRENLGKILEGTALQKIFEQLVKKELFMNPQEVAQKKEAQEFYNRIYGKTSELAKLLHKEGVPPSGLEKAVVTIRDNVHFMNELNQNLTFMQFPVQLPNGQAQGDLYVYTNKKSLREHPEQLSALLHLEMEHLGPLDVLIKMDGKQVRTNFCLESEEMLDFIYAHIEVLNARIQKLGLNCSFTMEVKEPRENSTAPVDFTRDFLDQASPVISVKSFLFDTKA